MMKSKLFYPCLLVLLWIVMIFIVNPIGNFPLNDDWQYARPAMFLADKGYYFSPDGYSPIIVVQVLWGSLFCLPGGFSFTALRISVLVLGLIGVLTFYSLVNSISRNKHISFLGSLLLVANPIYFSLSNTFMTDVPFLAFAIISIYLFFKSLETSKPIFLIAATIAVVLATLIRQFGMVIPIAYFIASLFKQKPKPLQFVINILPTIVAFSAFKLTLIWLKHIGSEFHPYYGNGDLISNPGQYLFHAYDRIGIILYYTGTFLLPFTIYQAGAFFKDLSIKKLLITVSLIFVSFPSLIYVWKRVPIENIINAGSIGPTTLREQHYWCMPRIDNIPHFSSMFSLVGFIGSILLLLQIGSVINKFYITYKSRDTKIDAIRFIFIISCVGMYALLMFFPEFLFDRYLLIFTPLFFLFICKEPIITAMRLPAAIISSAFIVFFVLFSSIGTHDYLAWNRSRWEAWNYAVDTLKVNPNHMDGGYECTGWVLGQGYEPITGRPKYDNEYLLTFGEEPGYDMVKQFPFQNYFPHKIKTIWLVHRKQAP
jgi:hypothetical protein